MDKDIKVLMKEAKEAYKKRVFADAVNKTKIVLKREPGNYLALVLQGAAFQELGKGQQSLENYKKAVLVDPKQLQAWQGIIVHYEKQGVKSHPDLLDAYKRVATYFEKDDKAKYIENTLKLTNALTSQQDYKSALKVLTRLSTTVGLNLEIAGIVVQILNTTKSEARTPEHDRLYTSALEVIVTESPQPAEDTFRKYFAQLNRAGEYKKLSEHCFAMQSQWNIYYSPMEWICRLYLEDRLTVPTDKDVVLMDVVTEKLFKLHPSSTYGYFARGKFMFENKGLFSDAVIWLKTGLESSYNLFAVEVLIIAKLKYGDCQGAYDDCQSAIRKSNGALNFRLLSVEALIGLDIEKAQNSLDKVTSDISESETHNSSFIEKIALLQAKLHVKKLQFHRLANILEDVEASQSDWQVAFYKLLTCNADNPVQIVETLSNYITEPEQEDNFDLLLEVAIVIYDMKEYTSAADMLFKATKLLKGTCHPLPWKYLGHLYNMQNDPGAAAKCFNKSYELNPSPDVGALLSDAYFTLGEETKNKELLLSATKQFRKANSKWAWVRLGLLHLHKGEANEAVLSLQSAVRTDHEDCHIWESLADAYFARGSYTAALKAYTQALNLGADPTYPKLKIGVVFQALGEDEESIKALTELLQNNPNYTPILVELAKSFHQIAQKRIAENLDVSATQAVEEGLIYAVRAIKHSPKPIILPWKIIGDFSIILSVLPRETQIKIPVLLLTDQQKGEQLQTSECEDTVSVTLEKFLEIGTASLHQALRTSNEKASNGEVSQSLISTIYYTISRSYYVRSISHISDSREVRENLLKKAVGCAKKAVSLNQKSHIFWNMLGCIAQGLENDELAQHSFIKSLEIDSNNAVAWCNLGILYLKHNKPLLAHKVFAKAQSVEPTFATSWIGQALVAEKIDPKEAMDLYRHASQLNSIPLSILAYADWVCHTLIKEKNNSSPEFMYSIVHLEAVNVASDLIGKIVGRLQTAYTHNVKGILSGWNGLQQTALEAFTSALNLASKNASLPEEEIDSIRSNRASVLVKLGRYEEAREDIENIKHPDFISVANAALICDKSGDLQKASQLYQNLYSLSNSKDDKSNSMIALALVINRILGVDEAKTYLFQSSENPHGLLALCAIGLMNNEQQLVQAALQELKTFENDPEFIADLGLMRSCASVMEGNLRPALNALLKLIHQYPTNAKLWTLTSQILLTYHTQYYAPSVARNFILSAIKISKTTTHVERGYCPSDSTATLALTYLLENNWQSALVVALKALKNYPLQKDNWAVLACALWFQYSEVKSTNVYNKILKILDKVTLDTMSSGISDWMKLFSQQIRSYSITS